MQLIWINKYEIISCSAGLDQSQSIYGQIEGRYVTAIEKYYKTSAWMLGGVYGIPLIKVISYGIWNYPEPSQWI